MGKARNDARAPARLTVSTVSNIVANGSLSSCASSRWGIYEKALPAGLTWDKMLDGVTAAGYQFLEISIDESDERLRRLEWPRAARRDLHAALNSADASIDSMCLSAHRTYSLGSSSKPLRERGLTIMRRAIEFAAEFGLRIVQVAGYDVFYEESTDTTRGMYLEGILQSAAWARESCVMLGLENVDCPVADSVTKALRFVEAAGTPWFQLYPDVANLAAMGHDPSGELRRRQPHRRTSPQGRETRGDPPRALRGWDRRFRRRLPDIELACLLRTFRCGDVE